MHLSDHALRRPVAVWVFAVACVLLGAVSLVKLKLDFLPQMDFPFIGVYCPYPNAVPLEVEREIARPIEEVMATLGDVKHVFSEIDQGGCFVGVEFRFGKSVDVLRMDVKDRLDAVRPILPADVRDLYLFTFNSNDIPILEGRISAHGRDLSDSYELIEQRLIRPLERIDGIGRVTVDGIAPKEVTIYLRMDKVQEHRIDLAGLFRSLNQNNVDLSLGTVRDGYRRVTLRALGQFADLEEIRRFQAAPGVRLEDIAEVSYAEPQYPYLRRLNGEPAVAFTVQKASGANIVEVSRKVNRVLEEVGRDPAFRGIDVVLFFDQAEEIRGSLKSLLEAGIIGSLLAILVIWIFVRRVRTTLIVSIAIPFSLISTCAVLYLTGHSLNVLSMMGLMLAVGNLVDTAIVVLEAIFQRQQAGESADVAARTGAREVAMPVIASTLTSIIVFLPIMLSRKEEIAVYLSEVGITISTTHVFALLVCLTLVPLLAARNVQAGPAPEFRFLSRWRASYLAILHWTTIRHPRRTGFLIVPAVVGITVLVAALTKFSPDPESERGMKREYLRIEYVFKDNTNLYQAEKHVLPVEAFLMSKRDSIGVGSIYSVYTDNDATMKLYFKPGKRAGEGEMKELRKWLRKSLPVQAGLEYRFGEREEVGKGARKLAVTLFGDDGALLKGYGEEVRRRLAAIPGLADIRSDLDEGKDEVLVLVDRPLAGRYGIDPAGVAAVLGLTFRGAPLRDFETREREVKMAMVLESTDRKNLENLRALPVGQVEGRSIPLAEVARFEMSRTPGRIHREEQRNACTVQASYEGEEWKEINETVERSMNSLELPPGYSWAFGRDMRENQEQQSDMGVNILLALCCVYFVMAALFESFLHPLVIMTTVPFGFLGVLWTLIATRTPLNLMAMIGVVILIGVIVNNGIVLIDHVNGQRRRGLPRAEAVLAGCRERFRPVVMTAATTVLGLVPLAFGDSNVGGARYAPMARALMGGLTIGTILTLLLLPTFYVLAEDGMARLRAAVFGGHSTSKPEGQGQRPPAAEHA